MAFLLRGTQQPGVYGVARPELRVRSPFSLFHTSRTLERPLILHRFEKPEIKKGICVDICIGGILARETVCCRIRNRYSAFHLSRCSPSHLCLGASTIRFALDEHARTSRLLGTKTTTITLHGNGAS